MPFVIQKIETGSAAAKTRLRAGDTLVSINGHAIRDVLDYKFYGYDASVRLTYLDANGIIRGATVRKQEGEDLGLQFETYLMDKARACANHCIFCFVDQLPPGMRETLYFKDDDARLSFLMGNYITLTNLSDREVQRIIDLHISPIHVSVHTTNPALRDYMLGSRRGGHGLEIMRRFAEHGIVMHCQIVCCPDVNDRTELQRSMEDLAALYPSVNSVSIVPVGLTKHREGLTKIRPFDQARALETVKQVEAFAAQCQKRYETRIFFCADELYLKAGLPIPPDSDYEAYAQLENGVGMLRLLETEFCAAMDAAETLACPAPFSIATGVSAAPFLEKLLEKAKTRCPGLDGRVYPIVNDFFGHTIDVAGLITGQDLVCQLKGQALGTRVLFPQNMLRHGEGVFLDDVTTEMAAETLGVPLIPVEQDGMQLFDAIFAE